MANLLSREKEFLRLNEKLDNIATTVLDTAHEGKTPRSGANAGIGLKARNITNAKSDQRYFTYTKSKGPSTLLKKTGAGDAGLDALGRPAAKQHTIAPKAVSPFPKPVPKPTMEAARKDPPKWNAPCNSARSNAAKNGTISARSKRATNNTIPKQLTIKYVNPNFVESPSLEEFLQNEECFGNGDAPPTPIPANPTPETSTDSAYSIAESLMNDISGSATIGTPAAMRPTVNAINGNVRPTGGAQIGKKYVSNDGLVKFLKSKVAILEEDHDQLTLELKRQKELLEKSLERQKKTEQQRDQAYAKCNSVVEQLTKAEQQLEEANQRISDCVREHTAQNKEAEKSKRELKLYKQSNANLEKRLYNATEEIEGLKNTVTVMKNIDREQREAVRSDGENKDKQIKNLKKQRSDLLNAYKKQLYLIENLKRQNICMEQSKMISFGENEFSKVLDWNVNN